MREIFTSGSTRGEPLLAYSTGIFLGVASTPPVLGGELPDELTPSERRGIELK